MKLIVLLVLFMTACTSLEKKGDNAFEEGSFDVAADFYEMAVKDDPENESAAAKLKTARLKVIDTKLIQVRKARMSNNHELAVELLLEVFEKQDNWQSFPNGAVAFTQTEEVRFEVAYLKSRIEESHQKKMPLRASYILNRYRKILDASAHTDLPEIVKKNQNLGKQHCRKHEGVASNETPFYAGLISDVCKFYGVNSDKLEIASKKQRDHLYGSVELSQANDDDSNELSGLVVKAFKNSAWYASDASKSAQVDVDAMVRQKHDVSKEHRTHHYSVRVPYTEYETQFYTEMVPKRVAKYTCDYDSSGRRNCRDVYSTDYRSEQKSKSVPTTKYRNESRSYGYWVSKHELRVKYQSRVKSSNSELDLSDSLADHLEAFDDEHDGGPTEASLYADPLKLPDWRAWVKEHHKTAAERVSVKLSESWQAHYCTPRSAAAPGKVTDQFEKCLRDHSRATPAHINAWYEKEFGIDAEKLHKITRA